MKTKHLISILDLEKKDILEIFETTKALKERPKHKRYMPLEGKTLAMIFSKPSTRTRVSFEVGMYQLGGAALFLSGQDLQLRRGETISDTAKTLSRYVDGIMIRTFDHKDVLEIALHGTIPVINGLTDLEHPCQALGDVFTIIEHKLKMTRSVTLNSFQGLKFVFIGDGNNVANSMMLLCAKLSMNFMVITPSGYEPEKSIYQKATEISNETGAKISISNKSEDAAGADVIYTDVWASMGKDEEREKRKQIFKPYQVNTQLLSRAKDDCIVMHCLPAHRGEEITDEVIDGKNSVVFDQAENRLHVQKAILLLLLGEKEDFRQLKLL
ncbi:MAG: ornithine carbamoyltransferase [Elusimicrobiota bacterium]|nr:ornithine carbamoyltransferase [Elusimicrobiota bacterium]